MATLYPPSIESKIPAQAGSYLYIPFTHNRVVGNYKGLQLLIKSIASNTTLMVLQSSKEESSITSPCKFSIAGQTTKLNEGEYYAVQLAYLDKDTGNPGMYSSVGIFKYTDYPTLSVSYTDGVITGKYVSQDDTEPVYSCRFKTKNHDNVIIEDSDTLLHNSGLDTNAHEAFDQYELKMPLELNDQITKEAVIYYSIETVNGLKISEYITLATTTYTGPFKELSVEVNPASGAVVPIVDEEGRLYRINETRDQAVKITGVDYGVQQGESYEYRFISTNGQQYQAFVTPDFEDMFLSDAAHQLCVRFNPKVSSFKETVQESKITTLGGQFPITVRNGNQKYKEFQISGLLSFRIDPGHRFKNFDIDEEDWDTLTSAQQVALERKFKLAALDWLNNGEPKLFRSPTEGNYIVRLTNISLTPNDQLGRMLHTFSASAYEIAEITPANLRDYNIVFKEES